MGHDVDDLTIIRRQVAAGPGYRAMVQAAVRLLVDPPARPERLWFRGELVVRRSTSTAPRD